MIVAKQNVEMTGTEAPYGTSTQKCDYAGLTTATPEPILGGAPSKSMD